MNTYRKLSVHSQETKMNNEEQPEDTSNSQSSEENSQPDAAPPPTAESSTPPPEPTPQTSAATASGLSKDSLNMGMLCHLLAFSGLLVPFGTILGPLIMWLVKKDTDSYVDEQGKESLNFQITMMIYSIVAFFLIFVVIGAFLLPAVILANIVLTIIGTIKASKGEPWKYPLTIRLIK